MKNKTLSLALILLTTPAMAQTKTTGSTKPAPAPTKVTSTYKASGTMDLDKIEPTAPVLNRLEKAKVDLTNEQNEITELRSKTKDSCELDELKFRQMDLDFLSKNANQISEIVGKVKKGLKAQLQILRGFESGNASGEESVDYTTPDGKTDKSAIIEFNDVDASGNKARISIPVKNLIAYIRKFEAAAAKVADGDKNGTEALLREYRDPNTAKDPKYFFMTLQQAIKAYSGCTEENSTSQSGCLSSVFRLSYQEEQSRVFFASKEGKDLFRVRTTTTMGYSPKYNNHVGTQLRKDMQDQEKVQLSISMNFGQAFSQAKEDDYWSVLRAQQLTISYQAPDGRTLNVPVDGYLRRIYFDSMRDPNCQKGHSYTFDPSTEPGPYQDYSKKTLCTKVGMEILGASMTKVRNYNGNRSAVGSIFDLTSSFKSRGDGRETVTSPNGFYDMVSASGVGSCDDVSIQVTFRCGCERTERTYKNTYKLGHPLTVGCN